MRRQLVRTLIVAVVLFTTLLTVQAEPVQQQAQVQITSPEMGEQVRGMVPIMGSASTPDFQFRKVEFGVGPNPTDWALIGDIHENPVINGQLEVWDTTKLPDGVYSLRLHAVKRDGNWVEFQVRQVAIVNAQPTATPTATGTPTKQASPTRVTPQATATLQIIAPTAALAMPTVTPTLSRPSQRQVFPVNPEGWGQAFVFGAGAMAAVFLLLGIVFGLRKLL